MPNNKTDPGEIFEELSLFKIKQYARFWAEGPNGFEAIKTIELHRGWPKEGRDRYFFVVTTEQSSPDFSDYKNNGFESCIHIQGEIHQFYKEEPPKGFLEDWEWWNMYPGSDFVDGTLVVIYERKQDGSQQVKKPKLRPNQKDAIDCRRIAKKAWDEYPVLDYVQMVKHPDILKVIGRQYRDENIPRKWIKKVAPKRVSSRGIRSKETQLEQERICQILGIEWKSNFK